MAFVHGKSAGIKLDNAAGTLQDISAYCDDISFPRSIETAETTVFGNTAKTYIVGLTDSTVSISGKWDSVLDTQINALVGLSSSSTFEYGPTGTAASSLKYSGECFVTSYEVKTGVGDAVTFSLELQVTGAVTKGTF